MTRSKPWYKQRDKQFLLAVLVFVNFAVLQFKATRMILSSYSDNDKDVDVSPHKSTTISHQHRLNTNDQSYMSNRIQKFNTWYEESHLNKTDVLLPSAVANGTIIDFIIAGFPKCGTTTLGANLGSIAPMPQGDICTPVHQIVYYAYRNWPAQFREEETQNNDNAVVVGYKNHKEKLWRGVKCPAYIQGLWLEDWSKHLPKTKIIVGIRHPILWFQSFWNMQLINDLLDFANNDPYRITKPCPNRNGNGCRNGCPNKQLFCVHRGRFHHALAALGKTTLGEEERMLLGPDDPDGGMNLRVLAGGGDVENSDDGVRNPIFLYDQNALNEEYFWKELGDYLGVKEPIQNNKRVNSHGYRKKVEKVDFCDDHYNNFRAIMMPIAYNVSVWLQEFFIPLAKDENRMDVFIPQPDTFAQLVDEYKFDPCGKLKRLSDGSFVLDKQHNITVQ